MFYNMSDERFSRLHIPVHSIPHDADYKKAFPSISKYPEFEKFYGGSKNEALRISRNALVRYMVYLYDYNSDLIDEHPSNLLERKEAGAVEAGFKRNSHNRFGITLREKIFAVKDPKFRSLVKMFLKVQNSTVWTEIVVTRQELEQFQQIRFKPVVEGSELADANKKQTLMNACTLRIERLEILEKQFYRDHRDLKEADNLEMITPENAMRLLADEAPYHVLSN
ncbi:hypothetical protein LCGC14_0641780 [marine sediment metagenome]|uniref:Uncharacterized protein n=1 Tax=marine sediment metagenome TaxID=412755 RepID=A0A0F9QYZ0_9ZZZZ